MARTAAELFSASKRILRGCSMRIILRMPSRLGCSSLRPWRGTASRTWRGIQPVGGRRDIPRGILQIGQSGLPNLLSSPHEWSCNGDTLQIWRLWRYLSRRSRRMSIPSGGEEASHSNIYLSDFIDFGYLRYPHYFHPTSRILLLHSTFFFHIHLFFIRGNSQLSISMMRYPYTILTQKSQVLPPFLRARCIVLVFEN